MRRVIIIAYLITDFVLWKRVHIFPFTSVWKLNSHQGLGSIYKTAESKQ